MAIALFIEILEEKNYVDHFIVRQCNRRQWQRERRLATIMTTVKSVLLSFQTPGLKQFLPLFVILFCPKNFMLAHNPV